MVLPGRNLLNGEVEVDETFVGGVRVGKRGRGAAGKTGSRPATLWQPNLKWVGVVTSIYWIHPTSVVD